MVRRPPPLLLAALLFASGGLAQQPGSAIERSVPARLAPRSLLLDVVPAGNALVAVGERGHILISEDGAGSWKQADVPTRATLTAAHFFGTELGPAVGHDAVIVRTTDGGSSWTLVHQAPEEEAPLLDVIFLDARRAIAIGAYGSALVSSDGGASWVDQPVGEEDFHLNAIARSATGRLYIAAESGNAYRSDDDGETWRLLETPYEGSFFGILPLDGDTVLLFGLRGNLFRSEDAGESWRPIETGTVAMLNAGIQLPGGRIVVVGLGGNVLVSGDGGRSFSLWQQESRLGIQALAPAGRDRLVLVGEGGVRPLPLSELATRKDR
jgi:photosystem II stability/assembly factor-like uncharacterized protein